MKIFTVQSFVKQHFFYLKKRRLLFPNWYYVISTFYYLNILPILLLKCKFFFFFILENNINKLIFQILVKPNSHLFFFIKHRFCFTFLSNWIHIVSSTSSEEDVFPKFIFQNNINTRLCFSYMKEKFAFQIDKILILKKNFCIKILLKKRLFLYYL